MQAVRSLPVFPCHLCMRGSVQEVLNYFCPGSVYVSLNQTSCVGFAAALSHPPLFCSDWLRDIEGRERKKRVRQRYSLPTLTHCED